jgi:hypothetical protein
VTVIESVAGAVRLRGGNPSRVMVMFADSVTDVDGLLDADDDCVGVLVGYSVSLLRSIVVEIVPVVVTLADRLCSLRSLDRLGDGVTVGMDVFVREGE